MLALVSNASNEDLILLVLTGKQTVNWSGSFTGGFRTLLQLWPPTLVSTKALKPLQPHRHVVSFGTEKRNLGLS